MEKISDPAYQGVERRRHKVLVTRNTEYHFRDGLCVAVRDRRNGAWIRDHAALQRAVSGSLGFLPNGGLRPSLGQPKTGEALLFATGGEDLLTSPLVDVERPEKGTVETYPRGLRGFRSPRDPRR